MAIYKLKPRKDTTIYPDYPTMNTGLDEIIEILPSREGSSRILIEFDNEELQNLVGLISGSYEAELKLYKAEIESLNKNTKVNVFPVTGSWDMGTGRYLDKPINTRGVTWNYKGYTGSDIWSYPGGDYITDYDISYTFGYYDELDLSFNVTPIVEDWLEGILENDGFILKLDSDQEFLNEAVLKYFSRDTHTQYYPHLTIKWDDSEYEEEDNLIETPEYIMSTRKKDIYNINSSPLIKINVSEKFPQRQYHTTYQYQRKHLPESSWYAIKDLRTDEYIINFSPEYTKISTLNGESFFKLYMNGLEPERHYAVCVKTIIDGELTIWQDMSTFKITK